MIPPHYVITGGPCAGKTTLIFELEKRGYSVVPEPARLLIDARLASGETIGKIVTDPDWLPSVVRKALSLYREVPPNETYFFDRAVPDSLAYYKANNRTVDNEFRAALAEVKFRKVFLLDLVDFANDEARSETPEEAARLHELIREGYKEQGYDIVEVPALPVPERANFVLSRI